MPEAFLIVSLLNGFVPVMQPDSQFPPALNGGNPQVTADERSMTAAYNRAYREKNREALRIADREKYQRNKKAIKARSRARYYKNRGTPKEIQRGREYRRDNRKRIQAKQEEWRQRNPDKFRATQKRWLSNNKAKRAATLAARRARKMAVTVNPKSIDAFIGLVRSRRAIRCYYCNQPTSGRLAHIDHVVSLVNGGEHSLGNLCASCPACNLKKNWRNPGQWQPASAQQVLPI